MRIRRECRIQEINSPDKFVLIGHWLFTKLFFPRSKPRSGSVWTHVNGTACLEFSPEADDALVECRDEYLGVPYGPKARLLLLHVLALAVLRDSSRVKIPVGMKNFRKFLGFPHNDGITNRMIRAQLARLCSGRMYLSFPDPRKRARWDVEFSGRIFEDRPSDLFGSDGRGFPQELVVTKEFFALVKEGWFAFQRKHLVALRGNSLAIDLYLWLVYRLVQLEGRGMNRFLRWKLVHEDFKGGYADSGDFARRFREALTLIVETDEEKRLEGVLDVHTRKGVRIENGQFPPALFSREELSSQASVI